MARWTQQLGLALAVGPLGMALIPDLVRGNAPLHPSASAGALPRAHVGGKGPMPATPASSAPALPGAPLASTASSTPQSQSVVQMGTVRIERRGVTVAHGVVLRGDGRILTSAVASAASDDGGILVRYFDGSTVRARVGHIDSVWDLALLVPAHGRWTTGLLPGDGVPERESLRVPALATTTTTTTSWASATLRARVDARSHLLGLDGSRSVLPEVFDVESPSVMPGAPLVDATGATLGIAIRACRTGTNTACVPSTYFAPVRILRRFLTTIPPEAAIANPWLGIRGESAQTPYRGVRVLAVAPGSSADGTGLRPADIVVALDGFPVESPDILAERLSLQILGAQSRLLVFGDGRFRDVFVTWKGVPVAPRSPAIGPSAGPRNAPPIAASARVLLDATVSPTLAFP